VKTTEPEPSSRRAVTKVATRSVIVDAAIAEFTDIGFARSSLDRVAAAADVTKGAVYHHFNDKEALFDAAFVTLEDRFTAKLTAAVDGVDDPRGKLAAGIDLLLVECTDPTFRRIAVLEAPGVVGWERWREVERRAFLGLALAALDVLAASGSISVPTGDLTARMLLAATSEAGCGLSASPDARSQVERRRIGAQIMAMIGLGDT